MVQAVGCGMAAVAESRVLTIKGAISWCSLGNLCPALPFLLHLSLELGGDSRGSRNPSELGGGAGRWEDAPSASQVLFETVQPRDQVEGTDLGLHKF